MPDALERSFLDSDASKQSVGSKTDSIRIGSSPSLSKEIHPDYLATLPSALTVSYVLPHETIPGYFAERFEYPAKPDYFSNSFDADAAFTENRTRRWQKREAARIMELKKEEIRTLEHLKSAYGPLFDLVPLPYSEAFSVPGTNLMIRTSEESAQIYNFPTINAFIDGRINHLLYAGLPYSKSHEYAGLDAIFRAAAHSPAFREATSPRELGGKYLADDGFTALEHLARIRQAKWNKIKSEFYQEQAAKAERTQQVQDKNVPYQKTDKRIFGRNVVAEAAREAQQADAINQFYQYVTLEGLAQDGRKQQEIEELQTRGKAAEQKWLQKIQNDIETALVALPGIKEWQANGNGASKDDLISFDTFIEALQEKAKNIDIRLNEIQENSNYHPGRGVLFLRHLNGGFSAQALRLNNWQARGFASENIVGIFARNNDRLNGMAHDGLAELQQIHAAYVVAQETDQPQQEPVTQPAEKASWLNRLSGWALPWNRATQIVQPVTQPAASKEPVVATATAAVDPTPVAQPAPVIEPSPETVIIAAAGPAEPVAQIINPAQQADEPPVTRQQFVATDTAEQDAEPANVQSPIAQEPADDQPVVVAQTAPVSSPARSNRSIPFSYQLRIAGAAADFVFTSGFKPAKLSNTVSHYALLGNKSFVANKLSRAHETLQKFKAAAATFKANPRDFTRNFLNTAKAYGKAEWDVIAIGTLSGALLRIGGVKLAFILAASATTAPFAGIAIAAIGAAAFCAAGRVVFPAVNKVVTTAFRAKTRGLKLEDKWVRKALWSGFKGGLIWGTFGASVGHIIANYTPIPDAFKDAGAQIRVAVLKTNLADHYYDHYFDYDKAPASYASFRVPGTLVTPEQYAQGGVPTAQVDVPPPPPPPPDSVAPKGNLGHAPNDGAQTAGGGSGAPAGLDAEIQQHIANGDLRYLSKSWRMADLDHAIKEGNYERVATRIAEAVHDDWYSHIAGARAHAVELNDFAKRIIEENHLSGSRAANIISRNDAYFTNLRARGVLPTPAPAA